MVVLRHVTFESGDFSEVNNYGGVIVQPGLVGNYAASFTSPPTADFGLWSWDPVLEYPELYYGCLVKFPAGFVVPWWQMIFEINAPYPIGGGEHVMLMIGSNNEVMLQFYSAYSARNYDLPYEWGLAPQGTGDDRVYELHSGVSMPMGETVSFEVYVKTSLTDGNIIVKMNGVEVINYKGRTQFDPEEDGNLISTMWGNYCDATRTPAHEMIMDEIYVATTPITPPMLQLPFTDNFANLDKWTQINGTWSAP